MKNLKKRLYALRREMKELRRTDAVKNHPNTVLNNWLSIFLDDSAKELTYFINEIKNLENKNE